MKNTNTNIFCNYLLNGFALLLLAVSVSAALVIRKATGAANIGINLAVLTFATDLGSQDNGVGGSYKTGYRNIS